MNGYDTRVSRTTPPFLAVGGRFPVFPGEPIATVARSGRTDGRVRHGSGPAGPVGRRLAGLENPKPDLTPITPRMPSAAGVRADHAVTCPHTDGAAVFLIETDSISKIGPGYRCTTSGGVIDATVLFGITVRPRS